MKLIVPMKLKITKHKYSQNMMPLRNSLVSAKHSQLH